MITAPAELTIQQAAVLKGELLSALEGAGPVELDLSQVLELDSAGLQLLLLLAREASAAHRELRFSGHSAAVLEVLGLLHLAPDLRAAEAAP